MRECLYKEITSIIDRHSTWIDVGKTCRYVCFVVVSYNRIRVVPCRTLPLRAYHNKWHYNYGIKDVKGGRAKQATQYSAYIWMVSQPFVLIDDFGLALLTESQMATFKHVAQDAQPTINKLNARLNTKEKSAFVPLLLKLYIANY